MLAHISRQTWWRNGKPSCDIDLDPHDWRAEFDAWRRVRTGHH